MRNHHWAFARNLRCGAGRQVILRDLTFTLLAGQCTAIMGPGSAGKSTLLRLLAGRASELWHQGSLVVAPGVIGWMSQQRGEEPRSLAQLLSQQPGERDAQVQVESSWAAAPEIAAQLFPVVTRPLAELPLPLARLATLTALLAEERPVLLLDEPEVDLDTDQQDGMVRQLRQLSGRHTVVLTTHNLRFARAVADHAMLLDDGRLVESAAAGIFFTHPSLERTRHYVRMGN